MKCEYCSTENESKDYCKNCGAKLSKEKREDWKGDPFFYNGYIVYCLKHWEKDAVIDSTEPGKELLRIPTLHNKYLNILTQHRIASKRAQANYMRMKKTKWEYYTGKLSQEELEERLKEMRRIHDEYTRAMSQDFQAVFYETH